MIPLHNLIGAIDLIAAMGDLTLKNSLQLVFLQMHH